MSFLLHNPLDIAGAVLGLLYLYLEVKENAWMWIVGLFMPAIYVIVLYQKGIYADCGMELYYFLAGVYGLWYWMRGGRRKGRVLEISHASWRPGARLFVLSVLLWAAISAFLVRFTDSSVPYIDGFTTALSVVALWMLSRKYIEQWWVWFVVDAVSAGLYIYKGIYGRALLYAVYTVMAVYGYYAWKGKLRQKITAGGSRSA